MIMKDLVMNVNIFLDSANHPRFKELLIRLGDTISNDDEVCVKFAPGEADLDIIWGSWKDRDTPWHNIKREVVAKSKKFLVLETPLVGRKPTQDIMDDTWYRVGINGFLGDDGFAHTKNSPSNRYHKMHTELGITFKPWKIAGDHVVVCLQLPGDASLRGADIGMWAVKVCHEIKKYTNKRIILRTPQLPRHFNINGLPNDVVLQQGTAENLQKTLDMAYCLVTYSSGIGSEALLNGTPVIAMSPASMVYSICSNSIDEINNPKLPERLHWISDIGYAQWSQEELYNGDMWTYIRSKL